MCWKEGVWVSSESWEIWDSEGISLRGSVWALWVSARRGISLCFLNFIVSCAGQQTWRELHDFPGPGGMERGGRWDWDKSEAMPGQHSGGKWEVLQPWFCLHCSPPWFWFCFWYWKPWALPLVMLGNGIQAQPWVLSQDFGPFGKDSRRNWAHVAGHELASDKPNFHSTGCFRALTAAEASFSLSLVCLKEHWSLKPGTSTCLLFCHCSESQNS